MMEKSKEITEEDRKKDPYYDKLHKEFIQKYREKKNKWISWGDRLLSPSIFVMGINRFTLNNLLIFIPL